MATSKHGGYRPGAGRKKPEALKLDVPVPAPAQETKITKLDIKVSDCLAHKDAKVFLMALMNDLEADIKLRADAAKALLPFQHAKVENTIKSDKQDAAKKAATGKFGAAAPPLRIVNGR